MVFITMALESKSSILFNFLAFAVCYALAQSTAVQSQASNAPISEAYQQQVNLTRLDVPMLITSQDEVRNENRIEKKITIIVGDAEVSTDEVAVIDPNENDNRNPSSKSKVSERDSGIPINVKNNGRAKSEVKFFVNESTKLIYINENTESGFLIGEFDGDRQFNRSEQEVKQRRSGGEAKLNRDSYFEQPVRDNFDRTIKESNKPTNYSVFLISRHKDHIAVLIDIEEIDFEPVINCENQELRFSIVGEISRQLLNRKDGNEEEVNEGETTATDTNASSEHAASASESAPTILPVSEAMAILLNAPLNKTLLDESLETNDFKIIDSTIDFLHEETCHELISSQQSVLREEKETNKARNGNRTGNKRSRQRRRMNRRSKHGRKKHHDRLTCPEKSSQFKEVMTQKLNEYFEWEEFKIVCGNIKQLVLPMRSVKISLYSDEFSPKSKFTIRYKFISDPSVLPTQDNGKYYCRNRNIIELSSKCDGIDDCGDASDESIKICGYPVGKSGEPAPAAAAPASTMTSSSSSSSLPSSTSASSPTTQFINGSHSTSQNQQQLHSNKRKLTYVNGDVLHCCQSNDWLNVIPHAQSNPLNLQSLIGESMNIFSTPLFAPTRSTPHSKGKKRIKRIVGGGVAQKGAWPAHASLAYEVIEPMCHFCAGTLIHPHYVLTAGHCITKEGLTRGIKVIFGAHDLRQLNGNHIQVRYVDDAHIYPGVDVKNLNFEWENDMNNDIALLRLNAPVLITSQVAPACLPPFNTPLSVNTTCRSIGWGQTHGSGNSNLLKHLSLKVVNSSVCSKELFERDADERDSLERKNTTFGKASGLTEFETFAKRGRYISDFDSTSIDEYSDKTMICVNNDHGHGICQGDSGGPLYCDRVTPKGEHCTEIYGVASFIIQYATVGAMCAIENLPGIFGEVSSKTEWISSTMKMFEQSYRLKYP